MTCELCFGKCYGATHYGYCENCGKDKKLFENAQGRCCNSCNDTVVIPARIKNLCNFGKMNPKTGVVK